MRQRRCASRWAAGTPGCQGPFPKSRGVQLLPSLTLSQRGSGGSMAWDVASDITIPLSPVQPDIQAICKI